MCCPGTWETLTDKYQSVTLHSTRDECETPLSPRRSSGGVLLVSADGSSILPVAQVKESFLSLLSSIPCFILQRMLLLLPSESVQNLTCFLPALAAGLVEPPHGLVPFLDSFPI